MIDPKKEFVCIYCQVHTWQLGLHELETWRHCPSCVEQYNVDVIYRYSTHHKCYSQIILGWEKHSIAAYQVNISPLIPSVNLYSVNERKQIDDRFWQYIPYNYSARKYRSAMRTIIKPQIVNPYTMHTLSLPITSLWHPRTIKNKINTYLLFL